MRLVSSLRSLSLTTLLTLVLASASIASAQVQQPPPVVERLEPTAGPVGTNVQLVGRFFRQDQQVFLGNVQMPVSSRLPSRWTVAIPPGATSGRIEIRLADGVRVQGPELRVLAATALPTIAGFTPIAGSAGSEIRIQGENFSPRLTDNAVTLNGVALVVRAATPTEITVILPQAAASGPFVVRVAGAGEATSTTSLVVGTGTQVVSVTPAIASPGARITIAGTGYSARPTSNRVFIENIPLAVVSATETQIIATLPPNAITGRILVDVRGAGRAYSATPITVLAQPTVTGFAPTGGIAGTQFSIQGTNFGTDIRQVQVSIGTLPVTLRALTPTLITGDIPQGAVSGVVNVSVAGLPVVTSTMSFNVLVPVAVGNAEPSSGAVGTEVLLRGRGFSTVLTENQVVLSGVPCPVVSATATELRLRIPQAASGPLVVTVVNAGTTRTTQPFVITTPPFIARVEPNQAPIGSLIRIVGTSFGTNSATVEVALAGRRLEIRAITNTTLDVLVPPGAVSGRLTVSVRLQGMSTSPSDFTVLTDFAFTATEALNAYPGQTITLRGGGFVQTGLVVTFTGGTTPAIFTFVNGSELRVVVPEYAQTGPVTIRLPDGRSLSQPFTRAATPGGMGITEVVPSCLRPGCAVTIRGWGFGTRPGAQTVTIYGQRLRIVRASPYQLDVTLPRTPGVGPFQIVMRGQANVASQPFTIAP